METEFEDVKAWVIAELFEQWTHGCIGIATQALEVVCSSTARSMSDHGFRFGFVVESTFVPWSGLLMFQWIFAVDLSNNLSPKWFPSSFEYKPSSPILLVMMNLYYWTI